MLKTASPILNDAQSVTTFIQQIAKMDKDDLAIAQANALAPIWQAIETSDDAQDLTAPRLHRMFTQISALMHVTQLQRPIIAPLSPILTQALESTNTPDLISMLYGDDFGYKTLFTAPKTQHPHQYQFTFMSVKSISQQKQHLTVMPVIRMDANQLALAQAHAPADMLTSFQDLFATINHDYIHAATAPIINTYFDNAQNTIPLHTTPYAQALNYSDAKQTPYYVLYQGEGVQTSTPLSLTHYNASKFYLEGHALFAHKQLYSAHIDPNSDIKSVTTFFAGLNTLTRRLHEQYDAQTATTTAQYFTLLVYERALHMVPYTHPIIKAIETAAAALPVDKQSWLDLIKNKITPNQTDDFDTTVDKNGVAQFLREEFSKNAHIENEPTLRLIRMCAHMQSPLYWLRLHKETYNARARKTAISDLHTVLKTTISELNAAQNRIRLL